MKKKKIMGHNVFVPLDDQLEVTVTPNFYTHVCGWCNREFASWREDAQYCTPSHKAMAGRKRSVAKYEDKIVELKKQIAELEQKHEVLVDIGHDDQH